MPMQDTIEIPLSKARQLLVALHDCGMQQSNCQNNLKKPCPASVAAQTALEIALASHNEYRRCGAAKAALKETIERTKSLMKTLSTLARLGAKKGKFALSTKQKINLLADAGIDAARGGLIDNHLSEMMPTNPDENATEDEDEDNYPQENIKPTPEPEIIKRVKPTSLTPVLRRGNLPRPDVLKSNPPPLVALKSNIVEDYTGKNPTFTVIPVKKVCDTIDGVKICMVEGDK